MRRREVEATLREWSLESRGSRLDKALQESDEHKYLLEWRMGATRVLILAKLNKVRECVGTIV